MIQTVRSVIGSLLLISTLLVAPIAVCSVTIPTAVFILPFSLRFHGYLNSLLKWAFVGHLNNIYFGIMGIQLFVSASSSNKQNININDFSKLCVNDRKILIISNHPTRLDWMMYWPILTYLGRISSMVILMKESLRSVPFFGSAMEGMGYIFLNRKWEVDIPILSKTMKMFARFDRPLSLLLFPEGTDSLCVKNRKKDDEFSVARGLPLYTNVLHPRPKGFIEILQTLKKEKSIDAVYDSTIFYPKGPPAGEHSALFGRPCESIRVHIHRYNIKELPESDVDLQSWLEQCFEKKEKLLNDWKTESPESNKLVDYSLSYLSSSFAYIGWITIVIVCLRKLGLFMSSNLLIGCVMLIIFINLKYVGIDRIMLNKSQSS